MQAFTNTKQKEVINMMISACHLEMQKKNIIFKWGSFWLTHKGEVATKYFKTS